MDALLPVLVGLALIGAFLTAPFVAWAAFLTGRRQQERIARLERRLAALEGANVVAPSPDRSLAATVPGPTAPASTPAAPSRERAAAFETRFAQRWLVWLGALALVLGGLFAAGWAVEQGLVGPRVRVLGAALLGFALVALGERARRGAAGAADFVAPALTVGGLSALYGAALAAHLAYGLVEPGLAFLLLALTSAFGVVLGLRHGPLVALLGALGAYATPFFVTSDQPAAWALFLYLGAVALGLAALARLAGRIWIAWLDLAGATAWQLVWLVLAPETAPAAAPGLHLLALGVAGLAALLLPDTICPWPAAEGRGLRWAFRATVGAAALLHQPLLLAYDHATGAVATLVALSVVTVAAAWVLDRERWLAAVAAAADLAAAASWAIPALAEPTSQLRDPRVALEPLFWIAPEAAPLVRALGAIAAAYGLIGLLAAWRGRASGYWAGLSVAMPLLTLATAYWRLEGLAVSPGYAAMALVLAAVFLLVAERVARRPDLAPALGAYAIGVIAALALGCTMTLADAWLTVALAVLLPAIALVGHRLDLPAVRRPAWVLAALVLGRLLLDVDLLATGEALRVPRLLYAYGVPLLAFWLAARWFRRGPADPLAELLAGGAVLFWLLLVAQLVRQLLPPAGPEPFGLAESALDALLLLGTAYALLRWRRADESAWIARFGWPLLAGLAGVVLLLGPLTLANPLRTGASVGPWPLLDQLLLAYAAPALVGFLLAYAAARAGEGAWARGLAAASHLLAFVWLTLELRHWFQGPRLDGPTGEGEWLAYSAAWLAWAALLLLLGVRLDRRPLRVAALAIATLAIAKTFLLDLAELGGLYRAASFLALGLCLVGIGWLYRRLVATPQPQAAS